VQNEYTPQLLAAFEDLKNPARKAIIKNERESAMTPTASDNPSFHLDDALLYQ
jgi:hypothetical protein